MLQHEKTIERSILSYLDNRGGSQLIVKINTSGVPMKNPTTGQMYLRPFSKHFSQKYMSDIFYLCQGRSFFLEIKRPSRATVKKLLIYKENVNKCEIDASFAKVHGTKQIANQFLFIHRAIQAGGYGGFAMSIFDVHKMIEDRKPEVYVPTLEPPKKARAQRNEVASPLL